jgi:hypothetical protein
MTAPVRMLRRRAQYHAAAVADWNPIPSGSMRPTLLQGDVVLEPACSRRQDSADQRLIGLAVMILVSAHSPRGRQRASHDGNL